MRVLLSYPSSIQSQMRYAQRVPKQRLIVAAATSPRCAQICRFKRLWTISFVISFCCLPFVLFGFGTGVVYASVSAAPAPSTWPNGYNYQATFTVAAGQVPSAQSNFPALISGTYADFATTASGGKISNTCTQVVGNNSTSVPCDLIFTSDAAGTQLLSWEFETWNAATGALNVWVNVPNLANGTVIYAWYGQSSVTTLETAPSATWTNYMAVYHMKENPAGAAPQLNDSTGNGNNATMNGPVLASQQQAGEINGSINFEGDTWASLSSPSTFSFERTDSFSLSGWYKIGSNAVGSLISKYPTPFGAGWELEQFAGASSPQIALAMWGTNAATGAWVDTPQVSMGVWHYIVATYSGTGTTAGMNIYIDGVQQTLTTEVNDLATSILNNDVPAISSRALGPAHVSNDAMDELRVSAKGVVYSPAWVTATYNNERSPGTFFGVATGLTNQSTAPIASLSPALSFANTLTGRTSSALAATLSNTGSAPLNNIVPSITGANPSDFAISTGANVCGSSLAAGSSCSIYVTFTPASATSFSATLSVADSAGGSPQTVPLSGTAATGSTSQYIFGSQADVAVPNTGQNWTGLMPMLANQWQNPVTTGETYALMPTTGTFSSLCINLTTAPGAGASWIWTLYKNGSDQALSVTISGAQTRLCDAVDTTGFVPGDLVALHVTPSSGPAPASTFASWYIMQTPQVPGETILFGSQQAGNAQYLSLAGNSSSLSTEPAMETIIPAAGTVTKYIAEYVGTGSSVKAVLDHNQSATSLSASLTSGVFVEQTGNLGVSAGDVFDVNETGITATSAVYASIVFVPNVAGQFVIPTYSSAVSNADPLYYLPVSGRSPNSLQAAEANAQQIGGNVQIQGEYVQSLAAPGSGAQYAFTLRDNDANTALSTTLSGANLTACATSAPVTGCVTGTAAAVNNFDLLDTSVVPAGNPAATTVNISYLAYVPQLVTPTITWPAPAAITYGAALGGSQLDATSTIAGTFSYSPAAGTVLTTGTHIITATFTPTDTTDYATATDSVSITVGAATPTITWATPAAISYGTALGSTQLDASSTVAGTFSYSPAAGTVLSSGIHTITATFTPTDTIDYSKATSSVSVTVGVVTPTITWPAPAAIAYGTALGSTLLDASSTVAGTFTYSPAAGTVLTSGTHTLTATFTPTDTADYATATDSVSITVGAVTPTITWPAPAAINYGTALGSAQLDASSTVAGTFSYSPAAGTVLTSGTHTITATFTPTDTTDYVTATDSVSITVSAVTPTITWPAPVAITYGTALGGTQLDASSTVAGTFSYSPAAGTMLTSGTHTITATFTPTDTTDYATATSSVSISVGVVTPTITWPAPVAITYGTALSSTQLDASSTVAGTFSYSPAAGTLLTAGSHAITATFTPTDTSDYNAATATVTLTMSQANPAITWATPSAITYGTALSGTQLDASSAVAGTFVYSPAAGTILAAGSQTLSVTFSPSDAIDYTTATATVTLTVNLATSTLSINATSVGFGDVELNTAATQSVTLTSIGTAPVTVNSATLTGNGFSLSGAIFPVTLSPNQAATLYVQFDPSAVGAATGQLTIASNSSNGATAVINLSATGTAPEVDLDWEAPVSSADPVAGYDVYRAPSGTSAFQLLNSSDDTETTYVDSTVQSGQNYDYFVASVDASGNESVASNIFTVAIP